MTDRQRSCTAVGSWKGAEHDWWWTEMRALRERDRQTWLAQTKRLGFPVPRHRPAPQPRLVVRFDWQEGQAVSVTLYRGAELAAFVPLRGPDHLAVDLPDLDVFIDHYGDMGAEIERWEPTR